MPICSLPRKILLGGSMLANNTFLFVYQISPYFLHRTRKESQSITFLLDFGYLESFRRYSRSKSKVVKNRAEFWTFFFALPNFRGPVFQKLYACYDPCLAARRMENAGQSPLLKAPPTKSPLKSGRHAMGRKFKSQLRQAPPKKLRRLIYRRLETTPY